MSIRFESKDKDVNFLRGLLDSLRGEKKDEAAKTFMESFSKSFLEYAKDDGFEPIKFLSIMSFSSNLIGYCIDRSDNKEDFKKMLLKQLDEKDRISKVANMKNPVIKEHDNYFEVYDLGVV